MRTLSPTVAPISSWAMNFDVRRTSKFMAHDELGATVGDKVRIVETRPLSARKRWRVIEIVQKAAK